MKIKRTQIAAVLAFVIGAMAVVAGGRVLLGADPGYYVIDWLPVYNFTVGVITVGVTAVLIWKNNRYAWPAAVITLAAHGLILLTLLTAYRAVVAPDSLVAMTVRLVAWVMILALLFRRQR
jgi:hypothetical protein